MPAPAAPALEMPAKDRQILRDLIRRPTTEQRIARRARVLLDATTGLSNIEIARRNDLSRISVTALRARYAERGINALEDAPRPGRPATIKPAKVEKIVATVMNEKPKHVTHWTRRALAAKFDVSSATVDRILKSHRLQPERVETSSFPTIRTSPKKCAISWVFI